MLDLKSALARLADDTELFAAVADAYIEDIAPKMEALNAAILAKDMDQLSRVCHSLKGTSSTVGAMTCFELAQIGEKLAADGNKDKAFETVSKLKNELMAVSQELRDYLATL